MPLEIQLQTGVPASSPHASTHEKGGDDGIATLANVTFDSVIVDTIAEKTTATGVTIDGVKLKDSQPYCDVINEKITATGVTVDGVLLKDSQVTTDVINEKTSAAGVTIDGVLLKDSIVTTDTINEKTGAAGVTADGVLLKDGLVDGVDVSALALTFVRADKDGDGDYDPLTAAAWSDSTKSGSGTINLNTAFGIPATAKAVVFTCSAKDDAVGSTIGFKAKSTTTNASFEVITEVANVWYGRQFVVPIAADGTVYYTFSATFTNLYLRVVGWYI